MVAKEYAGASRDRPLHLAAAYQQRTDVIKVLIQANKDVIGSKNKNGNSPIGTCILHNDNLEVMSCLMSFSSSRALDTELFDTHDQFAKIRTRVSYSGGNFLNRTALHCVILRKAPWYSLSVFY